MGNGEWGIGERNEGNDGNAESQGGNVGNRDRNHFSDQSLKTEIIKIKHVKPIQEKF